MADNDKHAAPDQESLLQIIKIQAEVAELGMDLGGVMALVAQRTQSLTHATGAVVELAEGEDMVYRAACGLAEHQLGLRLKRHGSLSGLCVAEDRPLRCDDSETDPRVNRAACRLVGLRSMVTVPLKHTDHVVGVLKVMAPEPHAFDAGDTQTLGLLSGLIASSMFHAARSADDEIFHRATHDPLTGLANRALFFDRLRQRLSQAQRNGEPFGVLNLDLDGLKPINDRHGHRAGDAVIKEFGERLHQVARRDDTVARLGGDEFGVVLSQLRDAGEAEALKRRIDANLAGAFRFEECELKLSASMGWALFPKDGTDVDGLLERADQAMYADKRERKAMRI